MVAATGSGKAAAGVKEAFKSGCPKCGKRVYAAERVPALGKDWHKLCLRCWECNVLLHAGGYQEHDSLPYCRKDYDKLFGAEGYGRSGARNVFALAPSGEAAVAAVQAGTTTPETTPPVSTTETTAPPDALATEPTVPQ
jgi:hypothetical protein